MSETNDKGCDQGDFEENESFYADSEYTKDTPKQMPKALKGVRMDKPRKLNNRPVSQCSTDSNFSSISGVIYGRRVPKKRLPSKRRSQENHKIYSTFKPANEEHSGNII